MGIVLFILSLITKGLDKVRYDVHKSYQRAKGKMDKMPKKESLISKILFYMSIIYTFIVTLPTITMIVLYGSIIAICLVAVISASVLMANVQDVDTADSNDAEGSELIGEGGGNVSFTNEQLSAIGTLLTDQEKNFYRLGIVAQQAVNGYGGVKYLSSLDNYRNVVFLMGISSIETGMLFYHDGRQDNILEIPSDIPVPIDPKTGKLQYGFMGLSPLSTGLDKMTPAEAADMKAKYSPKVAPKYDMNYAPWATYFAMKHLESKLSVALKYVGDVEKVFKEWGLDFNEETKQMVIHFMIQTGYHGVSYPDEINAYAQFWAMLLHATGDSNATRSYTKWKIVDKKALYAEGSFRQTMFGTNMDWKTAGKQPTPDSLSGIGVPVQLNGVTLNEPIWKFLYKTYSKSHGNQFMIAWKKMNQFASYKGGYGDRQLNFHYGFNSFIQGSRVIAQLSEKVPIVVVKDESGNTGVVIAKGNFKHEPGVLQLKQITWDGKTQSTQDFLNKYYSRHQKNLYNNLIKHVGKAGVIANPKHVANTYNLKYNKYGVPFHVQFPYGYEDYQPSYYGQESTFQKYGCMVYSMSYVLSAYTGLNINPPETALYLHPMGGLQGAMSSDDNHGKIITAITGKQAKSTSGSSTASSWAMAKKHLDAHNGVVIYRLGGRYAFGDNHYVVLIDSHDVDGRKMYSMYSSSALGDTTTLHEGDDLMKSPGSKRSLTLVFN